MNIELYTVHAHKRGLMVHIPDHFIVTCPGCFIFGICTEACHRVMEI